METEGHLQVQQVPLSGAQLGPRDLYSTVIWVKNKTLLHSVTEILSSLLTDFFLFGAEDRIQVLVHAIKAIYH